MNPQPVALSGPLVRLVPVSSADEMCACAASTLDERRADHTTSPQA